MRRCSLILALAACAAPAPAAHAAGGLEEVEVFTRSWVGDMAFSSDEGLPAGGLGAALGPMKGALRADVVTGNLEGTLTSGGSSKCGGASGGDCFAFRAPPSYARGFRRIGFDVLNLANNHAHDFGDAALAETARSLLGAGIVPAGLNGQIRTLRVGRAKLAFLGFSPYGWSWPLNDLGAVAAAVRTAARGADLVVVFFHGGAEGADATHVPFGSESDFGENRGNLHAFAHTAIDAGAGLVLGSGPHVIRGVERYRDRLVAYSLGNFAGPNTLGRSGTTGLSAVLRLRLTDEGDVLGGRWIPVQIVSPGVPRFDPSYRSVALMRSLSYADFGNRFPFSSTGRLRAP
jgi:hypothetical protein